MEISIEGKMNKKNQDKLQHLLELDFTKLEPNEALDKLGILLDLSYDQKFLQGTEKAIKIGENLLKSLKSSKDKALLYYFLANAHSDKHKMESYKTEETIWAWESPYLEKPLLYLRQAILEPGFNELSRYRKAQIFTNLGNMLISIGRSLEAIEYWDLERKKNPQYEHCAVIVAEDITSRFLNVIGLFNGFIPIMALFMMTVEMDSPMQHGITLILLSMHQQFILF